MQNQTNDIELDAGSYRDPSGFVFTSGNEIYRSVSDSTWPLVEKLEQTGLLQQLMDAGDFVRTRATVAGDGVHETLRSALPDWNHFLWHERIPVLSYPYEWSFSMLLDAGLLQLRIQKQLLAHKLSLKDASAFNVQFLWNKPVFIDVLSVEEPAALDIWIAYSQFCRMHLYPLMLFLHKGLNFKNSFLASVDGMDVAQVYRIFGAGRSLRPDLFLDVYLQRLLSNTNVKQTQALKTKMKRASGNTKAQIINLERLERKLEKMRSRYVSSGLWSEYADDNTYSDQSRQEKEAFITAHMEQHKPETVLDLGCNTGTYSLLAARQGANVISVDSDHDCVESLYRRSREQALNVLPMVVDIVNPSPGLGFNNAERKRFLDRVRGDCVFALALVHHLLISARLPLPAIRDMMAGFTRKHLIIEFVERDDEMFQTLLALREDLYGDLTLDGFLSVFKERFDLVEQKPLSGTKRHLLTFAKKQ